MSGIKDISTSKQTAKRKRETHEKRKKRLKNFFLNHGLKNVRKKHQGQSKKKASRPKGKKNPRARKIAPGPEKRALSPEKKAPGLKKFQGPKRSSRN